MEPLASRHAAIMGARQRLAQGGIGAQRSAHRLCRHHNAGLTSTPCRKAEVFGADQHANAGWREGVVQCIGDLRSEALLHLQSSRKGINKARNLREANDATARHVANGGNAWEREEVMLAEGVEWDALNDNEITSWCARRLLEYGAENLVRVAGVSAGELKQRTGNTAWRLYEPVARWILANGTQDGAGGIGNGRLGPWGRRDRNGWSALDSHVHILPAPSRSYGRA